MKKILILEDNHTTSLILEKLISQADREAVIYSADNVETAYSVAMEKDIDLMLLDIVLNPSVPGDVSGIKFAENIRQLGKYKFVPIIMITSLEDPKFFAYSEIHCYSYIEKPFDNERVINIVKEALEFRNEKKNKVKYLYKKDNVLYSILLDEIICVESRNKKLIVHTERDKFEIPYVSIAKLIEEFDNNSFIQCSRSTIINKNYIMHVDASNRYIKMKGVSRQIDIGITHKKQFLANINND